MASGGISEAGSSAVLWLLGDIAPWDRTCRFELRCHTALANLEGPVLESAECEFAPRRKAGPALRHRTMPVFATHPFVSLANNHMMDYGAEGLAATESALEGLGMEHVGAGGNEADARAPVVLESCGVRVAVIACCERQFGAAGPAEPGVAVLGPWVFEAVRRARAAADAVIVSLHAGVEMLPWPEAWRREFCKALIKAGADIVHGHHSHVPQAFEEYEGGLITYGLGNCIVDPVRWAGHRHTCWSQAFEISMPCKPVQWKLHTLVCGEHDGAVVVSLATAAEAERHQAYLRSCNQTLADDGLWEGVLQHAACDLYAKTYAPWMKWTTRSGFVNRPLAGRERWVRPWRALSESLQGQTREWHSEVEDHLLRYHVFACDSHREMVATALGVLGGEIRDCRTPEALARWIELS